MIFYFFLGLIALAGLIISVYVIIDWWYDSPFQGILMGFLGLAGTACALLLGSAIYVGIAGAGAGTEKVSNTWDLKALTNGSEQVGEYSGGIFLSYGYTGEERNINYIWKDSEGLYSLEQIGVEDVKIREVTDGTTATIEVVEERKLGNAWIPTDWVRTMYGADQSYIFTVPEGTIGSEITIDNEK